MKYFGLILQTTSTHSLLPILYSILLAPVIHRREMSSLPPPAIANSNSYFQGLPLLHFLCKTFPKQTSQLAHWALSHLNPMAFLLHSTAEYLMLRSYGHLSHEVSPSDTGVVLPQGDHKLLGGNKAYCFKLIAKQKGELMNPSENQDGDDSHLTTNSLEQVNCQKVRHSPDTSGEESLGPACGNKHGGLNSTKNTLRAFTQYSGKCHRHLLLSHMKWGLEGGGNGQGKEEKTKGMHAADRFSQRPTLLISLLCGAN